MNNSNITVLVCFILIAFGLLFSSCKRDKDDPRSPQEVLNEEEVITTCKIFFTDVNNMQPNYMAVFRDPDGDGGNAPTTFDTIHLAPMTTYHAHILLLDESASPIDTISYEIAAEAMDHLFCFETTNVGISIHRTDSDGTFEIGLETEWTTSEISDGHVTVSLKHQPGIKDGTCVPGETDVEIEFPLLIQ